MKVTYRADGKAVYTTVEGDMVDQIAFNHYGTHEGATMALYDANPGLSDLPMVLQAGIAIVLPRLERPPTPRTTINLWD